MPIIESTFAAAAPAHPAEGRGQFAWWCWRLIPISENGVAAVLLFAVLALQFSEALTWLGRTLCSSTYGSFGLVPLAVLLLCMRRPRPRLRASSWCLSLLVTVAGVDLLLWPLGIHFVSAILCVLALNLYAVAVFQIRRPFRMLALSLLGAPLVHWGNVLFGFELQHLVSRVAGAVLRLYGLRVHVDGTVFSIGDMTLCVDQSCSGIKMLVAGLLLGLFVTPQRGRWRQVGFWLGQLATLLLANVMRVVCLALASAVTGQPVSDGLHQGIGLAAFATACGLSFVWARCLSRGPSSFHGRGIRAQPLEQQASEPWPAAAPSLIQRGRRWSTLTCVLLLSLMVTARWIAARSQTRRSADRSFKLSARPLPAVLGGDRGHALGLSPSEALLAASGRTAITRMRYGSSVVARLTSAGLRELHPPSVCLAADGYAITARRDLQTQLGCVVSLTVRQSGQLDAREAHFAFSYFDGQRGHCSFVQRVASALLSRAQRRPATWTSLQVMDPDPKLARTRLVALLRAQARTEESQP